MTIIALTGYARSGKDSVGQVLTEHYGFRRVAFADKLKSLALELDPVLRITTDDDTEPYTASLAEVVECYGSLDAAKVEVPEVREFLQDLGVGVRDHLGEDAWVRAALDDLDPGEDVVVTDCRFRNEARAIHELDGYVIRVLRPGVKPANGHVSERPLPLDLVDVVVANNGTGETWRDTLRVNLDAALLYLNVRRAS